MEGKNALLNPMRITFYVITAQSLPTLFIGVLDDAPQVHSA
jgi:hypothetical protein